MGIKLSTGYKVFIVISCFAIAIVGFMIKLPSGFRQMDKELHAAFYFLAAAFLNILFAQRNLVRHAIIFVALYVFSMSIEYAQQYSNRFFRRRIHGRFDPEDMEANLNGLLAFSALWLLSVIIILIYSRLRTKESM